MKGLAVRAHGRNQSVTYMWLTGHVRNVGDSALRRNYAAAASAAGPLIVWAGDRDSGYFQGLAVPREAAAPSFGRWIVSFIRSVLSRRTNFVFNAGEFGVSKEYLLGMVVLLPWILLAKRMGGKVAWLGAGVPHRRGLFMLPFQILARAADDLRWRDSSSLPIMGRGAQMPDWAFAAVSNCSDTCRDILTISLRGDRPYPSKAWLNAVTCLGERIRLSIAVVVQVEDDQAMAERLARDLGARIVGWECDDHLAQEALVRDVYARSAATISDRLHALIIALTEGSVPLGWVDRDNAKLARHFDWLGAPWVCVDIGVSCDALSALSSDALEGFQAATRDLADSAKSEVEAASDALTELLR